MVHPSMTTKAGSDDEKQASDNALTFLREINAIVGPSNADFRTAFSFSSHSSARRERKHRDSSLSDDEDDKLKLALANKGALWAISEDFWAVVGWAFNCSVKHPNRWVRWKLWLDLMLDVIVDEFEEKRTQAAVSQAEGGEKATGTLVSQSLLAQYLHPAVDGRTGKRRIMRAIFADGSKKSLAEFSEVWKDETKESAKKDDQPTKRRKLNFDEDDFGDYFDDDDGEPDDDDVLLGGTTRSSSTRASASRGKRAASDDSEAEEQGDLEEQTSANLIEKYGGVESIKLRQRFLALLVPFCTAYPAGFMDTEDLFDLYTEFVRPLPLMVFQQFAYPPTPYLDTNSQATLNQTLLRPIISHEAPKFNSGSMMQAELEKHFLPFAANQSSVEENAKVSVLVESLFVMLWRHGGLEATASLHKMVKQGIDARKKKASFDGRKKTGRKKEQDYMKLMLDVSAGNIAELLGVIQG